MPAPSGPPVEPIERERPRQLEGAARRFPCQACGARLVYKPGTVDLECPYCGHANRIAQSDTAIEELDYHAFLGKLAASEDTEEHATCKCDACAAAFDRPEGKTAFACPFCGADIVTNIGTHRLLKPRALLPFKIENAEAQARFKQWVRKLWFAPNELTKFNRMDHLVGVYTPYWTYDSHATSSYSGMRGEYYYVTVGSGKNRRRVRRTRWWPASGVVYNSFDDILIVGSHSLPGKLADKLRPWDLHNLVPYEAAFLSGFQAEHYQVDLAEGFAAARVIMDEDIRETVRADIGGDTQQIHSISSAFRDITFKHILLPVWISAYRYRGKTYRYLVNGRTGEVQGERPYSWVKILLAVLLALIVIGGIVYGLAASGALESVHVQNGLLDVATRLLD